MAGDCALAQCQHEVENCWTFADCASFTSCVMSTCN
jgi:hypothetical protein